MKLGIDSYSTRNSGWTPWACSGWPPNWAGRRALRALPLRLLPRRLPGPVRRAAEEKGLYVEFGMGSIFHWHPMAEKGRQLLADGRPRRRPLRGPDRHRAPARRQEARLAHPPRAWRGNLFTRDEGHDMAALADRAVAILREACRAAEDLGMKIAMETHADFTVRELASILARVNSPAFGFTVDCANLAFDLDDPSAAGRDPGPARPDDALQELPHCPHADRAWHWKTAPWARARSTWPAIAELLAEA